jgi:hypothetical protein
MGYDHNLLINRNLSQLAFNKRGNNESDPNT